MPQYKDIDAILNNLPDDLPYKASVKRVLIQAPEADVVSKSEADNLIKVIDNTTQQFLELHDLYQNAKSEVERLQESNSSLQRTIVKLTAEIETLNEKNAGLALACMYDCMANDDCLGHNEWKAIKAEVAREIFEEIENLFLNNHIESFKNFHDNWHYRFKVNMMTEIAELKKKYTEVEKCQK